MNFRRLDADWHIRPPDKWLFDADDLGSVDTLYRIGARRYGGALGKFQAVHFAHDLIT